MYKVVSNYNRGHSPESAGILSYAEYQAVMNEAYFRQPGTLISSGDNDGRNANGDFSTFETGHPEYGNMTAERDAYARMVLDKAQSLWTKLLESEKRKPYYFIQIGAGNCSMMKAMQQILNSGLE